MPDFTPRPEHKFSFRSLDRRQSRPRSVWRAGARRRSRRSMPSRCSAKSAPGASTSTTTISCRSTPRPPSATASSASFKRACKEHGLVVPMATVNLFFDPVSRTARSPPTTPRVRAYALQKTMRAMDLGAELGAKIFVLWGGREGTETDACRRPDEAIKRLREASIISASTRSTRSTASSSRSKPSPTSRAATSTWRRPARTWLHPDARSSGNGRREPGSRARADGRA